MIGFEELLVQETRVGRDELTAWIERRWVRPLREDTAYRFGAVDVARVRLICELRQDLAIDEDTIPLVLSLLDQLYGLRRRLRLLGAAVAAQPDEVRARIQDDLRRREREEDDA